MSFCTECGKELDSNARFCGECGTKVMVEGIQVEIPKTHAVFAEPIISDTPIRAVVSHDVRISPLYGVGFKSGIHCYNCGSRLAIKEVCSVCDARQ